MSTLKTEVHGGQALVTDLEEYPDGTVVELAVVSDGDLSEDDLARLDASLAASRVQLESGQKVPAEQVLAKLQAK